MTWDEAFEQLSADWKAVSPDPLRMRRLLDRIGHPEERLHFIHIAGTNGKGSASAMLSEILTRSGYRTGRYISPHLSSINERWSVDGKDIEDERLAQLLEYLRPILQSMEDRPTKFELLTALGFLYFEQERCQAVVLEVGLGGRLDATNVIPVPNCALIMNIGLEHTEILGDTPEKIAFEKGGIIKSGGDVVLYHQSSEVEHVVRRLCRERGAKLVVTEEEDFTFLGVSGFEVSGLETNGLGANSLGTRGHETGGPEASGVGVSSLGTNASGKIERPLQRFHYKERKDLELSLLGDYQCRNACAVLDAVDALIQKGYHVPERAIRQGLREVSWPGRFEVLTSDPLCIADGAHNPNGAEALMESLRRYLPAYDIVFLMGVMADKDYSEMIRSAAPYAAHFIAQVPGGERERALGEKTLAGEIRQWFSGPVETAGSVQEGLALAWRAAKILEGKAGAVTEAPEETTGKTTEEAMEEAAGEVPAGQDVPKACRRRAAIVCFGSLYQVSEIRAAVKTLRDKTQQDKTQQDGSQ